MIRVIAAKEHQRQTVCQGLEERHEHELLTLQSVVDTPDRKLFRLQFCIRANVAAVGQRTGELPISE
ncbi:hypothetical protein RBWH47_00106 [Rhodopirellula baltica WH47]|uniref:Uncharacterized protein n=1 Tax=Rhodopirellula baltica WH47 TaxID=991778 RepID=F2B0K6_RHOBT|nr:hypothetical protein RBWH47_00106 [Rhodopirellula baltica WH47]